MLHIAAKYIEFPSCAQLGAAARLSCDFSHFCLTGLLHYRRQRNGGDLQCERPSNQAIRWAAIMVISVIGLTAAMAITKTEAPAPDHTWSQPANFFASPYSGSVEQSLY
jgi:hypothetical protein